MADLSDAPPEPFSGQMPDGGPVYAEDAHPGRFLVEPWNAATAAVFLLLVVFWVVRLRGRYGRYPFLVCCLPILAVGGIGGTVYHAFRAARLFLVMDFVPIYVLGLAVMIYLWVHFRPRWWQVALVAGVSALALVLAPGRPRHAAITVSYGALGLLILVPTVAVLVRTRFRGAGLVAAALGCFALALFFRFADAWRPPLLPMGTHWLWHLFGAATAAAMTEYVYRLGSTAPG